MPTKIIRVKFLKRGSPCGRSYTYFTPERVEVGDDVQITEDAKGRVFETDVQEAEIAHFKDRMKTIIGKAKPEEELEWKTPGK